VKKSRFKVLALVCIGLLSEIQMPLPLKANELKFYCDKSASIPITKIHTNRGEEEFIQWVQERGGYSVEQRCMEVSNRFNLALSRGQLYLKADKSFNGSQVICSVSRRGDNCDSNNVLVTLKNKQQLKRAYTVFTDFQRSATGRAPIKLSGNGEAPSRTIKMSDATGRPPVTMQGNGVNPYLTVTDNGEYFDLGQMVSDWNKPVNSTKK
jgi:Circadian oscillating protein COP23